MYLFFFNIFQAHDIPVMFLPYLEQFSNYSTKNFLLYFHGNAEDIYFSYAFINDLRTHLKMNVLAMEYPGYGEYKGLNYKLYILT